MNVQASKISIWFIKDVVKRKKQRITARVSNKNHRLGDSLDVQTNSLKLRCAIVKESWYFQLQSTNEFRRKDNWKYTTGFCKCFDIYNWIKFDHAILFFCLVMSFKKYYIVFQDSKAGNNVVTIITKKSQQIC